MSEVEKDSNELLNILLLIVGVFFIVKGILDFLAWGGILVPDWLSNFATNPDTAAALSFFGSQGLISVVLGFWCLVAGIGMFKEEEWAMGQALVVLSLMVVTGVSAIMGWIGAPASFDLAYWPNYIVIVAFIIGLVGFFWLLFTRKRYD